MSTGIDKILQPSSEQTNEEEEKKRQDIVVKSPTHQEIQFKTPERGQQSATRRALRIPQSQRMDDPKTMSEMLALEEAAAEEEEERKRISKENQDAVQGESLEKKGSTGRKELNPDIPVNTEEKIIPQQLNFNNPVAALEENEGGAEGESARVEEIHQALERFQEVIPRSDYKTPHGMKSLLATLEQTNSFMEQLDVKQVSKEEYNFILERRRKKDRQVSRSPKGKRDQRDENIDDVDEPNALRQKGMSSSVERMTSFWSQKRSDIPRLGQINLKNKEEIRDFEKDFSQASRIERKILQKKYKKEKARKEGESQRIRKYRDDPSTPRIHKEHYPEEDVGENLAGRQERRREKEKIVTNLPKASTKVPGRIPIPTALHSDFREKAEEERTFRENLIRSPPPTRLSTLPAEEREEIYFRKGLDVVEEDEMIDTDEDVEFFDTRSHEDELEGRFEEEEEGKMTTVIVTATEASLAIEEEEQSRHEGGRNRFAHIQTKNDQNKMLQEIATRSLRDPSHPSDRYQERPWINPPSQEQDNIKQDYIRKSGSFRRPRDESFATTPVSFNNETGPRISFQHLHPKVQKIQQPQTQHLRFNKEDPSKIAAVARRTAPTTTKNKSSNLKSATPQQETTETQEIATEKNNKSNLMQEEETFVKRGGGREDEEEEEEEEEVQQQASSKNMIWHQCLQNRRVLESMTEFTEFFEFCAQQKNLRIRIDNVLSLLLQAVLYNANGEEGETEIQIFLSKMQSPDLETYVKYLIDAKSTQIFSFDYLERNNRENLDNEEEAAAAAGAASAENKFAVPRYPYFESLIFDHIVQEEEDMMNEQAMMETLSHWRNTRLVTCQFHLTNWLLDLFKSLLHETSYNNKIRYYPPNLQYSVDHHHSQGPPPPNSLPPLPKYCQEPLRFGGGTYRNDGRNQPPPAGFFHNDVTSVPPKDINYWKGKPKAAIPTQVHTPDGRVSINVGGGRDGTGGIAQDRSWDPLSVGVEGTKKLNPEAAHLFMSQHKLLLDGNMNLWKTPLEQNGTIDLSSFANEANFPLDPKKTHSFNLLAEFCNGCGNQPPIFRDPVLLNHAKNGGILIGGETLLKDYCPFAFASMNEDEEARAAFGGKSKLQVSKANSLIDIRHHWKNTRENQFDSFFMTGMKTRFYLEKSLATKNRPHPTAPIRAHLSHVTLTELFQIKHLFKVNDKPKVFKQPSQNSQELSCIEDLSFSFDFSPVYTWNVLAEFLSNNGFFFTTSLLSLENLAEQGDQFSIYYGWDAMIGDKFSLTLFGLAKYTRSLALNNVKWERDRLEKIYRRYGGLEIERVLQQFLPKSSQYKKRNYRKSGGGAAA